MDRETCEVGKEALVKGQRTPDKNFNLYVKKSGGNLDEESS